MFSSSQNYFKMENPQKEVNLSLIKMVSPGLINTCRNTEEKVSDLGVSWITFKVCFHPEILEFAEITLTGDDQISKNLNTLFKISKIRRKKTFNQDAATETTQIIIIRSSLSKICTSMFIFFYIRIFLIFQFKNYKLS